MASCEPAMYDADALVIAAEDGDLLSSLTVVPGSGAHAPLSRLRKSLSESNLSAHTGAPAPTENDYASVFEHAGAFGDLAGTFADVPWFESAGACDLADLGADVFPRSDLAESRAASGSPRIAGVAVKREGEAAIGAAPSPTSDEARYGMHHHPAMGPYAGDSAAAGVGAPLTGPYGYGGPPPPAHYHLPPTSYGVPAGHPPAPMPHYSVYPGGGLAAAKQAQPNLGYGHMPPPTPGVHPPAAGVPMKSESMATTQEASAAAAAAAAYAPQGMLGMHAAGATAGAAAAGAAAAQPGNGPLVRRSMSVPSSLSELDVSAGNVATPKAGDGANAPPTPLSREERWKRIARFKNEKKPRLNYEASKKVAYQSRKKHADGQPRIGGRFVSKKMLAEMVTRDAGAPVAAAAAAAAGGSDDAASPPLEGAGAGGVDGMSSTGTTALAPAAGSPGGTAHSA